jgi:hypothetical protein
MENENVYASFWRQLRAPEGNLLIRLGASVASGLILIALACAAAWAFAQATASGYVRDEHIITTAASASLLWLVTLVIIWRPMKRGRFVVVPVLATLAVGIVVLGGGAAVDELLNLRDGEFLIAAIVAVGAAAVVIIWLPSVHRLVRGRPVVGPDNLVRVTCPRCGYSLIGLRDLRCPECGTEFTIDELIRAQGYRGVSTIPRGEAEQLARAPRGQALSDALTEAKSAICQDI